MTYQEDPLFLVVEKSLELKTKIWSIGCALSAFWWIWGNKNYRTYSIKTHWVKTDKNATFLLGFTKSSYKFRLHCSSYHHHNIPDQDAHLDGQFECFI